MPDEEPMESQESEAPQTEDQPQDHSTESDTGNPFWGDLEKQLGPVQFKQIKPHLDRADAEARSRVSKVNEAYAPFKAFADQGITPDQLNQAIAVTRQLNESPEAVYEALGSFLEREGRMPSKKELVEEVQDNEDGSEEDPEEVDPRDAEIATLREQMERFNALIEAQEQEEIAQQEAAAADEWLAGEVARVKQAHPDLEEEDMKDITRRVTLQLQNGQEPNFEVAAAEFIAFRDRILTKPRPSTSAPRVPSGTGGSPGGTVDTSKLSKAERIALVASRVQQQ